MNEIRDAINNRKPMHTTKPTGPMELSKLKILEVKQHMLREELKKVEEDIERLNSEGVSGL